MRVEFDYILDDVLEAHIAHQQWRQREMNHDQKALVRWWLLGWLTVGAVALLIISALIMTEPGGIFEPVRNVWLKLLGPFAALLFAFAGIAVIKGMRRERTAEARRAGLGGLIVGVIAIFWFTGMLGLITPLIIMGIGGGELALADAAAVAVPWVVIALLAWAWALERYRDNSAVRKLWEGSPAYSRRHTLETGEEGIVWSDGVSRTEQQWLAYTAFYESRNVLLLFTGEYSFHIIPKRAFDAGRGELEEFRWLATSRIEAGTGRGFAVLPVATAAMAAQAPSADEIPER